MRRSLTPPLDGGPFAVWLTEVAATEATFPGLNGHSYGFFSLARDAVGNLEVWKSVAEASTIVPEDVTPPVATVVVTPSVLWPPNHKMVAVSTTVEVQDDFDPSPSVILHSIASNETADGKGDGNSDPDIQGASLGQNDRAFFLRAERSGTGDGRVYTVTYRVTDSAGNFRDVSAQVVVPRDKR